jgi:L-fuconate dehydratase
VPKIIGFRTTDVRFPTSRGLDGSDAMNQDPDYSAAYLELITDQADLSGYGLVFTIGRGNDLQCSAIELLAPYAIGREISELAKSMGNFAKSLSSDSQMRWLGPEKGITHMAAGAVVNAVWDLICKFYRKPLWKYLSDLSPQEIVDLVDFRYIYDAITPDEALKILTTSQSFRSKNEEKLLLDGVPAYTTTPGWLGYSDEKMMELSRQAVRDGFSLIKLKCGVSLDDDKRRLRLARSVIGPDIKLAVDANQVWNVNQAIDWIKSLADIDLHWVEEPTNPDDVVGHAAIANAIKPVRVATGEHVANRIVFKQLMQSKALSFVQIDATRVAGVNENIAIILMAAKFGLPVCPHAGGVGLCEMVQHLAMFDYVAVGGENSDRVIEYVDHLHEHFVVPTKIVNARYMPPLESGSSAQMLAKSVIDFSFPTGKEWTGQK